MDPLLIVMVAAALFAGTTTRTIFGFGDALVAMPMMAVLVGLPTASPLMALIGLTTSVILLLPEWRSLDFKAAGYLIVVSTLGIPLGLMLLAPEAENPVKIALGIFLIGFGAMKLRGKAPWKPSRKMKKVSDFALCLLAGVFNGAFTIAGPPAVVYASNKGWSPQTFRVTLQTYFLVTTTILVIAHGLKGMWTAEVGTLYLAGLVALALGAGVGALIRKKINPERFQNGVFVMLIILGLVMLVAACRGILQA